MDKVYMAIDLKSFYASVECIRRNLNPLDTFLVVADHTRTDKTICLAVSPPLKEYGISSRARLFEVKQAVTKVNRERQKKCKLKHKSMKKSDMNNPENALSFLIARPQMASYLKWSQRIYEIYLKYFSPEDIHVYSIDEVFIDATSYLKIYNKTPKELARDVILDIYNQTGITATAGISTNLYLCKVAMDVVAKHVEADEYGVRIAQIDEQYYRKHLWSHKPITDFWRVGKGYAKRLAEHHIYTMGDVAMCSIGDDKDYYNEQLLYNIFGVNAELLIDHAWGYEPCTMKDIKSYEPEHTSIGKGQVLSEPYDYNKTEIVLKEMLDALTLTLVEKKVMTDMIVITIGYDKDNKDYGESMVDRYNRILPKHCHFTVRFDKPTNSFKKISSKSLEAFHQKINKSLTTRRINISCGRIIDEEIGSKIQAHQQLSLFEPVKEEVEEDLEKEKRIQEATIQIKQKFGKNSLLKGMDLQEGATTKERNKTIGGHNA